MKAKFIKYYMDIAARTAELSYARRLRVGAIVVRDNRIISIGYNGMPAGWDNDCEIEHVKIIGGLGGDFPAPYLETRPEVLHAERNALDKLARGTEGGLGATMFVTHAPCLECAKSIYGAGISSVYYAQPYRDQAGLDFLSKAGVTATQINTVDDT